MQEPTNPQTEPSKGATEEPSQGEPDPTSQGEPQGTPDPKTQEGTPQWYKSQLDKNQNAFDEKLTVQENVWAEKNQQLEGQLQNVLQVVEGLKKPQEEALTPPTISDPDDPTEVIKYLQKTIEYNNKVNDNRFKKFEEKLGNTDEQLEQDRKFKEDARNLEMVKTTSKGAWMEDGMTAEEAEECWGWQATVKGEDRIKTIGKMFKLNKGDGGSELADELKRRDGIKLEGEQPGAGTGGGAGGSDNPKDFSSDTDHSDMYKTK